MGALEGVAPAGAGVSAARQTKLRRMAEASSLDLRSAMPGFLAKTGALSLCSVQLGAVSAGKPSTVVAESLSHYAQSLGLAFQVVDDILDVTSDSVTLGKTAGKDAAADKPTYVSLLGLTQAQELAQQLHAESLAALNASGLSTTATAALRALASQVVERKN